MRYISAIRLLLFFIIATLLVIVIYFELFLLSSQHHQNIMRSLTKINNSIVSINEQVLMAHQGLLRNYDDLVRSVDNIENQVAYIKGEEVGDNAHSNNIELLEQEVKTLANATELFLSANAILSNSLTYLPNVINQFVPKSESDSQAKHQAYLLLEQALLYNRWHDSQHKIKIERLIAQLQLTNFSTSEKSEKVLSIIIAHAQVIYTYSDLVNKEIRAITNNRVNSYIDQIRQQHINFNIKKYKKAKNLRQIISAIAILLFFIVIKFFRAVRTSEKRLNQSNEKLALEIQQRSMAERKLQSEAVFLQTILDNISDGIVVCDNQGHLLVLNKAAEAMYGQGMDQMGSNQQYRLYDKQGKQLLEKQQLPLYKALEAGQVHNEEIVIESAEAGLKTVLVNGTQIIQDNGTKQGAVICIRDISELKIAEIEMRIAASAFESQEAILIADSKLKIIRVNKKFTEITGYQAEDVLGKPVMILQPKKHDQKIYSEILNVVSESGYWQGELYHQKKNGEIYLEGMSLSVVKNEDKEITHYISHFWDLTEYKLQQEQKIRSADEDRLIAEILKLSFLPLEEFLQCFADAIIDLPWMRLKPKCGICLNKELGNGQSLVCNKNLSVDELTLCVEKSTATCCCQYFDIDSKNIQLYSCNNTLESGFPTHSHYYVPISAGDELLGMVILYLDSDHQPQEYEVSFLKRLSDVLSLGISRKHAEEKAQFLAYHDGLTKLPNRMLLLDRLTQVVASNKRKKRYAALMYIDFDRFKNVNDSLGHSVGDAMLIEVAQRFKQVLREEDTVARLGGDEFVVLLTELPANRDAAAIEAQHVSNKLHQAIAKEINIIDHSLFISLSIGITIIANDNDSIEELMIQADTAMYQAKENGRNSSQFFIPEMQIIAKVKLALEKDLRYAIKRNEIQVYYQPQTNIKGDLIGAEALLRWIHPQRGHISPTDFIPIAEESGMILELGDFVLEDACKRIMQWKNVESLKHIAVNVSPVQFRHPDYVTSVEKIIQEYSLDTKKLTFELTEGLLVDNVEDVINKMQKLKNLGISFSIDDFGTGYSSLAYLTKFPLDQLKIDKSFIDDIGKDQDDQVIIETIIAMADRLSFNLIAEGVETNEQIQFLKEKGCFNFQGYYFSKPIPVEEFSEKYL